MRSDTIGHYNVFTSKPVVISSSLQLVHLDNLLPQYFQIYWHTSQKIKFKGFPNLFVFFSYLTWRWRRVIDIGDSAKKMTIIMMLVKIRMVEVSRMMMTIVVM